MSNNEQIKTIQQTFMEVAHAQHNGSAWYTKGDSGLYQQVSMWLGRGQAALADLEKQLAERDAALARCVEENASSFCDQLNQVTANPCSISSSLAEEDKRRK